jgi:hypothetical protein
MEERKTECISLSMPLVDIVLNSVEGLDCHFKFYSSSVFCFAYSNIYFSFSFFLYFSLSLLYCSRHFGIINCFLFDI